METVFDKLNTLARQGAIVPIGPVGVFGATCMALADGSAAIRQVRECPAGGVVWFHWINGWELISNGRVVARWVYGPRDIDNQTRAYLRAARWLLLKAV